MHTIVLQMAIMQTLSVYDIYDHMDFTLTLGTAKLVFRIIVCVKDVGTSFGLLMVTTREVQCNRQPGQQRSSSFVFGQRRVITS